MSLVHEFGIESNSIFHDMRESVMIEDDLIQYLMDTFSWIDTEWNYQGENRKGLNYYGTTIIRGDSIAILKKIVEGWITLFTNAPQEIVLTGCFDLDNDSYELLTFKKKDIINQLESLVFLCESALERGEEIIHTGI